MEHYTRFEAWTLINYYDIIILLFSLLHFQFILILLLYGNKSTYLIPHFNLI